MAGEETRNRIAPIAAVAAIAFRSLFFMADLLK
jgi:hypothetical protein